MGVVRVKPGVQFTQIAPGGFAILSAIDRTAEQCNFDLTITSACDGEHSGPNDPHHRGEAYDIRTRDLGALEKNAVLSSLNGFLGVANFFAFVEDFNLENEHIHVQVKKGTQYPPQSHIFAADL